MSNITAFVRPMCRLDGWRGGASGCMGNGWGQMLDHNPDNESSAQLSYRQCAWAQAVILYIANGK